VVKKTVNKNIRFVSKKKKENIRLFRVTCEDKDLNKFDFLNYDLNTFYQI